MSPIEEFVYHRYETKQLPCLHAQCEEWKKTKPLQALKILDSTPLFFNTVSKYLPLIQAGADLTIGYSKASPYYAPEAMALCRELGIKTLAKEDITLEHESYDIILDCAAVFRQLKTTYGYVELTCSGKYYYANAKQPVYFIDNSLIKHIEVTIGTGDGVLRALNELDILSTQTKVCLIGFGKVGKGIAYYLKNEVEKLTVVDFADKHHAAYACIDANNAEAVLQCVVESDVVIMATGIKNLVSKQYNSEAFKGKVLVNAGIEDEYGEEFDKTEIVHHKLPVNFLLEEPTQMKFLDAILALSNHGCLALMEHQNEKGIFIPDMAIQKHLMTVTKKEGLFDPQQILSSLGYDSALTERVEEGSAA